MTKGRRPTRPQTKPWIRWGGVLVGLVIAGAIVWWATRPGPEGAAEGGEETAEGPAAPRPLDASGGPTVEAAASLENVPEDSIVATGPDAPQGINVSNDPKLGDPNAPVTIVELSDFQCPFCARFHEETFPALRRLYGDQVRWIFVNRPFAAHQHAERAAIAAECAHRQGRFWEYAEALFAAQDDLGSGAIEDSAEAVGLDAEAFGTCLSNRETASEVNADIAEAERLGVDGTPTFYINGRRVVGAQPVGTFNQVIRPYFSR